MRHEGCLQDWVIRPFVQVVASLRWWVAQRQGRQALGFGGECEDDYECVWFRFV